MSGQTWTPAPRKTSIPLHPMTFGLILGRSFSSLRHNPKVIFGFAATVQFGITAIAAVVTLLTALFAANRIASVPSGSPDFGPILAGTIALTIVIGVIFSLASVAFTVVVQGLVAADVSYAALGRKAGLRMLWRRVKPAFWRLFAFSLLQALAVLVWFAVLVGIGLAIFAGSRADSTGIVVAILVGALLMLASVPLIIWLSTKLLVVPSALVLERATLGSAIVRSWRLLRGRFWVALGVMFIIGAVMGLAAQVVGVPASLLSSVLGGIISPTSDSDPTAIVTMVVATFLPQVLVLAVQAIALVVQGTAGTLIYIDSRMRYEGLDQTLARFVERSWLGASDDELGDPYAVDPARAVSKTPPPKQAAPAAYPAYGYPQGYPAPQGYPQGYSAPQGYPAYPAPPQGHPAPPHGYPAPPQGYPQGHPAPSTAPAPPYAPQSPPPPPPPSTGTDTGAPQADDSGAPPPPWTAPGGSA